MYSWEQIYAAMQQRKQRNGPILNKMIEVRDRYNGDWVVPHVSKEDAPTLPPLTPALIAETVDNLGMRAGSVLPSVYCPAVDGAKDRGKRSVEYARIRRRIITATYAESKFNLLLRKAYRHLVGYSTCSIVVMPDFKKEMPRIVSRDPLSSYPDPRTADEFCRPENVGFIFAKSAEWVREYYPEARGIINKNPTGRNDMWELCEWIDREHVVIGLLGPRDTTNSFGLESSLAHAMELSRWPNRTGMVTAICPFRVTLDRISSQLAHVTGITDLMARLMALDIMAREKGIFPDRYMIGRSGMMPQIVGGEWKDGRTGKMNTLLDVEEVGSMAFNPEPASAQAIDRLERNARISSGLVPQFGGETYGALRTGRGIDALMGAAVDPRIQEMQEIMQAWLPDLNEAIFETYRAYWPDRKYALISGWPTDNNQLHFTPAEHIELTQSAVSYPIAGADVQATNIILGQMLGAEAISKRFFRERHPWIGDAAVEASAVDEEMLERAAMQAILNQAATGGLPLPLLAEIEMARRQDPQGDIIQAILAAHRKIQEQQVTQAPEPVEGQVAPPETAPGLNAPPAQATPGEASLVPQRSVGPTPNMEGLRELMNALRTQNQGVRL